MRLRCVAHNKFYNGKSSHINLRHASTRELISNEINFVLYVRFSKNMSYPLTKAITRIRMHREGKIFKLKRQVMGTHL